MVRNLKIMNLFPKRPTRSCLNSTGPFELSLMAIAINNSIGSRVAVANSTQQTSSTRFHSGMPTKSAAGVGTADSPCARCGQLKPALFAWQQVRSNAIQICLKLISTSIYPTIYISNGLGGAELEQIPVEFTHNLRA